MAVKKRISGLTPGTWRFRFRAGKNNGIIGEWSGFFDYTVTGDTTPPPVPSKPIVTPVFGGIFVEWQEVAYDQPIDFNRVEVYVSNNGGPYVKFGSIGAINSGITYQVKEDETGPFTFKFTGVDRSGNVSEFSEASDPVMPLVIGADTTPPDDILGPVDTSWNGTTLVVTFDKNTNTDAAAYLISLTTSPPTPGGTSTFYVPVASSIQQRFTLTEQQAISGFGGLYTSYTGLIKSNDKINNSSAGFPFSTVAYVDTINNSAIANNEWDVTATGTGYIVSWTKSDPNYKETEVWQRTSSGTSTLERTGQSPLVITLTDFDPRFVKIRHVGKTVGSLSQFSSEKEIAAQDSLANDTIPPVNDFTLGTTTVEDDPDGLFSFNKKVLFTWTQNSDIDTAGYRVRFRIANSTDPYVYYTVPGKATTSTYLYGLKAGQSYEIELNTYDIYENTDNTGWEAYPDIVIPASTELAPDVAISAGDMKLGYGLGPSNAFKGLYLGPENYWYIQGNTTASSAARISVGGTNDKLIWDGSNLSATGTINANAGTFTGTVNIGSDSVNGQLNLYAGANKFEIGRLKDGSGNWLNEIGIQGTNAGNKYFQLDTVNGIITNKGVIGGWSIESDRIHNSDTVGLYSPAGTPSASETMIWAGGTRTSAPFRVQYNGTVRASSLVISGGTIDLGNDAPNGFHVTQAGVMSATGATIYGALNVNSPSTFSSSINIVSGGSLLIDGSGTGGIIKVSTATGRVEMNGVGIFGYNSATGGSIQAGIYANTGGIYAQSGEIGKWNITSSALTTTLSNGTVVGLYANDPTRLIYMGENFIVSKAGDVTIRGTLTVIGSGGNLVSDDNVIEKINKKVFPLSTNTTTIEGGTIRTGSLDADRISGGTITATITINTPNISMGTNNYWNSSGDFSVGNATNGSVFRFLPTGSSTTIVTGGVNQSQETVTVSGAALIMKLDSYVTEGGATGSRIYVDAARGNFDGTANDPTMVVSRTGQVTLGRTLYYAGNSYPNPNTSAAQAGVTNLDRSRAGDLYFTTGTL